MRAARYHGRGDIRVEEIPEPLLSDGKVHVDVEWCGICGSDLHEYLAGPIALPTAPHPLSGEQIPLTLGHELCGRIRNPPADSRFKDGDAVMVDPRVLCDSCHACRSGNSHCCQKLGYVGSSTSGGFGERVAVEERMLHPLGSIPLEYAPVIEPLAVAHHAIKEANVEAWDGKDVLVIGAGPIGLALIITLKAHGNARVIVSEPASIRREQVSEFAQLVVDPLQENVAERCRAATDGRGVEVVFDCAGIPSGLADGIEALRFEGLYVMVAVWEKPLILPSFKFLYKHVTMKGVLVFSSEDFQEIMELMAQGKIKGYEKMVTGRIGLNDIVEKGFRELIEHKDQHIKILVSPITKAS